MAQTYFASIQPGLEDALLTEIRRLGGKRPRLVHGGVEFDAARKTLYAAHLELRTPTRIWMRVDEFRSRDAPELYRKTRRYNWERLIGPENHLKVRAHSSESSLYHTGKISDAVTDAIRDRFKEDVSGKGVPLISDLHMKKPAITIMARLENDRCQLSLDASGDLLHRRGWRTEAGEAPLRETIAAAILEAVEWKPEQGLIDPMCGSGTIPIEAACRATGRVPGLDREFAFQRWQNFQSERYEEIRSELSEKISDELPAPIVGVDREQEIVDIAKRNAGRAGVDKLVEFSVGALKDTALLDTPEWMITNPPYGSRLDDDGALKELATVWEAGADNLQLAFLWPLKHRNTVRAMKLDGLRRLTSFDNGGLSVDLWVGKKQ